MNPATRTLLQVTVDEAAIAGRIFSTLMGDDVEARRGFSRRTPKTSFPRHLDSELDAQLLKNHRRRWAHRAIESRGDGTLLPRLRDVGHHLAPRLPDGARRVEPAVNAGSSTGCRRGHAPPTARHRKCDERGRRSDGASTTRSVTVDLRPRSPVWHRTFRCVPVDRRPRELRFAARPSGRGGYTEARLSPLAMELLGEIDEDTVDSATPTTAGSREPLGGPARFPNALGQAAAAASAVGIPPHPTDNLPGGHRRDAALIDNPEATRSTIS